MAEIAVAGAIELLKQTVSILVNLAAKEGARFFKLKEEIGWIEREMGYIQIYLRNADSIGEEYENTVESALVKDIRILAYDVEDIVETHLPLIATESWDTSVLGWIESATIGFYKRTDAAISFVKEIEGIKRRVEDISRVRQTYVTLVNNNGSSRVEIWEQRKHFIYANKSKIVGFDEHVKILETKVFDPKLQHHSIISIVGMPGLGKTTLAKKVLNSIKPCFDCSAMVHVSQTLDIRQLLLEVAKQVGLEEEKLKDNMEINLRKYLEDKRYVIVFDDIWDSQAWDCLNIYIPNSCINGSKIIITSRKTEVASQIGTVSSLYELTPLDKEDSWNLFQDMVITPLENANAIIDFSELETPGRMIAEKCGGVPLAIEAVAGLLLGKETPESEWKVVLERMGRDEDKVSRVLRLSYKDLPTELKPCFLYFGFFPEDYEVNASNIIRMWVAEGFLEGKRDAEPEDVGRDYLNQLVARNMVQVSKRRFDGRVGTCRVHDLWHAFCVMVGAESNFFNTDEINHHNNLYKTTRVRRVILSNREFRTVRINEFPRAFKTLRVLVLKVWSSHFVTGFVKGLGSLNNLKYFGFLDGRGDTPWVYSLSIPPLGNLRSLLTLDLRYFRCARFPDEIWRMTHLRHIRMGQYTADRRGDSPRKLYVPFSNLQTLHWVPAHAMKAEYLRGFPNLRKLGIHEPTNSMMKVLSEVKPISDKLVSLSLGGCDEAPTDLSRYLSLCKLNFDSYVFRVLCLSSIVMPPNLVKLTLSVREMEEDPIELWKSLPKLKIFCLRLDKHKRDEMVCSGGSEAFPQLEVLELDKSFLSPHTFVVEENAMPKLKRLAWVYQGGHLVRFEAPERIITKIIEENRRLF